MFDLTDCQMLVDHILIVNATENSLKSHSRSHFKCLRKVKLFLRNAPALHICRSIFSFSNEGPFITLFISST